MASCTCVDGLDSIQRHYVTVEWEGVGFNVTVGYGGVADFCMHAPHDGCDSIPITTSCAIFI